MAPNGFFRRFKGSFVGEHRANLETFAIYDEIHLGITLQISNRAASMQVSISDSYSNEKVYHSLQAGETFTKYWPLAHTFGWYDFTLEMNYDPSFQRQIAGHIETGKDSMTDPAIGSTQE